MCARVRVSACVRANTHIKELATLLQPLTRPGTNVLHCQRLFRTHTGGLLLLPHLYFPWSPHMRLEFHHTFGIFLELLLLPGHVSPHNSTSLYYYSCSSIPFPHPLLLLQPNLLRCRLQHREMERGHDDGGSGDASTLPYPSSSSSTATSRPGTIDSPGVASFPQIRAGTCNAGFEGWRRYLRSARRCMFARGKSLCPPGPFLSSVSCVGELVRRIQGWRTRCRMFLGSCKLREDLPTNSRAHTHFWLTNISRRYTALQFYTYQ